MCQDLCEGLIALQPSLTSYSALPVASQLSICRVTTSKSYELNHHHDFLLTIMGSRLKDGPYWDTVGLKPKEKSDGRTVQWLLKLLLRNSPYHFCSWFIGQHRCNC